MDGESCELFLFGTSVGALGAWSIRASLGALTFRASGRIPAYWLSAGADTARVRCVARGSDRRPFTPAQPDYAFEAEGVIHTLTATSIVLTSVKQIKDGNE